MSRNLRKTVCSEINIPFLMFCLEYCSPFPEFFENFITGVTSKKQSIEACFEIACVKHYSDKFEPETKL